MDWVWMVLKIVLGVAVLSIVNVLLVSVDRRWQDTCAPNKKAIASQRGVRWRQLLTQVHRLPNGVWRQLCADLQRGHAERGAALNIHEMFQVNCPSSLSNRFLRGDKNIKMLYHGTSTVNAILGIIDHGFNLPPKTKANMFGPGVYFAQVPQKSWDYTKGTGFILICDVALGTVKRVSKAAWIDPSVARVRKRTWTRPIYGKDCDTVHAPAGRCTVSDEHIVYDPNRVLPRFLVTFKKV